MDVPGRALGSIQAGHAFTVVTGAQGIAGDLVMATVDRLHAAQIETTTIEAPLPSLAALTRAISTALSVVVDTERPLVVIVRQADALKPDAMLRLPALAGLQRGGRPVLCFLLLGKPALWSGLATIGLGALEQDDAAHIRLAPSAMFQPDVLHPEPPPPRRPFPQAPSPQAPSPEAPAPRAAFPHAPASQPTAPAVRPRRPRRARVVIPAGIAIGGAAVLAALFATHRAPPAVPMSARLTPPVAAPIPSLPAAPAAPLRPLPDLSAATPPPPVAVAPMPLPLPDLPQPAPEPPALVPPAPALAPPAPALTPPATSVPAAVSVPPPVTALPAPAPGAPEAAFVLPEAGMLHIILRYSQGSDAAQAHAQRVAVMLRAAGATVDGPAAAADASGPSNIGYFFNADRGAADRLAHRLPAHFVHIRSPFGAEAGPMMRPGELIVTIGSDSAAAH
ncbi:hypothetical protein [Lichenicoccus sp.]|uniref:hypothetical protein n=1 Tax=Lichenicoccus sp. TaxID=2781899 RepID=UPI003D0F2581